jgi:hypothetical protein
MRAGLKFREGSAVASGLVFAYFCYPALKRRSRAEPELVYTALKGRGFSRAATCLRTRAFRP